MGSVSDLGRITMRSLLNELQVLSTMMTIALMFIYF